MAFPLIVFGSHGHCLSPTESSLEIEKVPASMTTAFFVNRYLINLLNEGKAQIRPLGLAEVKAYKGRRCGQADSSS